MTTVLIATSRDAPAELTTPLAAALAARDLVVKVADLGRVGQTGSRLGRVVQAIIGEAEAGRLLRELAASKPDVAVALDPGALAALIVARDRRVSATVVVALVPDLAPGKRWAVNADRFAVLDDEAAVGLSDHGVDGARVVVIGPTVPRAIHEATRESRAEARREYKLPADASVAVVDTRGFSLEVLSQLTLQLSLVSRPMWTLFDAGGSADAAAQLRRQVPTLGIKGKLFGDTPNAARLWRCADWVIARPTPRAIHAARALGAGFLAVEPEAGDERQLANVRAIVERGLGAVAEKVVFVSGTLEPLLARRVAATPGDGASEAAELVVQVAATRDEVLAETFSESAGAAPEPDSAAGDLEDLEGFDLGEDEPAAPPPRRASAPSAAEERVKKELDDARADAERWEQRRALAEAKGDRALAAQAAREADRKRARMHAALEELGRLASQRARMDAAPPREDPLEALKRRTRQAPDAPRSLDDELADLKSRVKKGRP